MPRFLQGDAYVVCCLVWRVFWAFFGGFFVFCFFGVFLRNTYRWEEQREVCQKNRLVIAKTERVHCLGPVILTLFREK